MNSKEFAVEFMRIMDELYNTYDYIEDIPTGTLGDMLDLSEALAKLVIESK